LFGLRIGTVKEGATFEPVSREGALVANNLLLSVILGVVLVGTLYPLAAEAISGEKLSVGPPYFNAATGPLALVMIAIMAAGPLIRWRRDKGRDVLRRIAVPLAIAAAAAVASLLLVPGIRPLPLFGFVLAAGAGIASLAPLWGRNLRRTPLFTWGMVIAHFGIAVSLAGMASESMFTQERLIAARIGEATSVGPYTVRLTAVEPIAGPNWTAIEGTLTARRQGSGPMVLKPQARTFTSPPTPTSEADIATMLDGQLYTVIGQQDDQGRWQLRLWWKPFVTLIWFGGGLVAFGGLLSLIGRIRRERRIRAQEQWA